MAQRTHVREPRPGLSNLRPHPYNWEGDPELDTPPGPYTRRATVTLNRLAWTIILTALRKSDSKAARKLGQAIERDVFK